MSNQNYWVLFELSEGSNQKLKVSVVHRFCFPFPLTPSDNYYYTQNYEKVKYLI